MGTGRGDGLPVPPPPPIRTSRWRLPPPPRLRHHPALPRPVNAAGGPGERGGERAWRERCVCSPPATQPPAGDASWRRRRDAHRPPPHSRGGALGSGAGHLVAIPPHEQSPAISLAARCQATPSGGGPPTGDVADGRAAPVAGRRGDAPLPASAIGPTPPRPAARGAITVCAVPPPPTESATTPTRVPLPSARPLLPSLSSPSLRTCVPVLCGCCPPAPAGPRRYGPAHVVWSPRRQGGAPGTSGRPRDLSAMPLPVDFFFFFFAASACR